MGYVRHFVRTRAHTAPTYNDRDRSTRRHNNHLTETSDLGILGTLLDCHITHMYDTRT